MTSGEPVPSMNESLKFEKALETISQFFAMDNPASSFNRVLHDLMETCPGGVIVGGMAVSFYVKDPRTTQDVDIAFADEDPLPPEFHERFEPVPGKLMTARHKETGIDVDLLNPANPVLNHALLSELTKHANWIERAGRKIRVASPEFIIGLKLHRALTHSVEALQDQAHILSVLVDNPDLEFLQMKKALSED